MNPTLAFELLCALTAAAANGSATRPISNATPGPAEAPLPGAPSVEQGLGNHGDWGIADPGRAGMVARFEPSYRFDLTVGALSVPPVRQDGPEALAEGNAALIIGLHW